MGFILTNLMIRPEGVVNVYNGRGTAEQWIKEGKHTLNWTRLSCHKFVANQARLQLFVLAYNLGNFLRRLALPKVVKEWSLHSLQLKLIKTGAKLVHHARRLVFQHALGCGEQGGVRCRSRAHRALTLCLYPTGKSSCSMRPEGRPSAAGFEEVPLCRVL